MSSCITKLSAAMRYLRIIMDYNLNRTQINVTREKYEKIPFCSLGRHHCYQSVHHPVAHGNPWYFYYN